MLEKRVRQSCSGTHGTAAYHAMAEWARNSLVCNSVDNFKDSLSKICEETTPGREAVRALMGLGQGKRRVADYAIKFRTMAVERGWNSFSLCNAFLHGLAEHLKNQIAPPEFPGDLDSLAI